MPERQVLMKQRAAYPQQVLVKLTGEGDDNDLATRATKVRAGRLREQIKAVRGGGRVVRVAGSLSPVESCVVRRHMPSDTDSDGRAARKARADAIRRARDRRNARLNVPADADATGPGASTTPVDHINAPADTGREPNYVEFIDRKMRQPKTP